MAKGQVHELSGRTYEVKDEIKRLGGRWDGERKVWTVVEDGTMAQRREISQALYDLRRRGVTVS